MDPSGIAPWHARRTRRKRTEQFPQLSLFSPRTLMREKIECDAHVLRADRRVAHCVPPAGRPDCVSITANLTPGLTQTRAPNQEISMLRWLVRRSQPPSVGDTGSGS